MLNEIDVISPMYERDNTILTPEARNYYVTSLMIQNTHFCRVSSNVDPLEIEISDDESEMGDEEEVHDEFDEDGDSSD